MTYQKRSKLSLKNLWTKTMTLIDFNKKELLDIYRALQYTRFEECPVPHDDEGRELYNRLTKLMEKVSNARKMCTCKEDVSNDT